MAVWDGAAMVGLGRDVFLGVNKSTVIPLPAAATLTARLTVSARVGLDGRRAQCVDLCELILRYGRRI